MQLEAIIEKVLPVVTGTSSRGEWKKQDIVVRESTPIPYPDSFVISFMGDKTEKLAGLQPGMKVNVIWSAMARMYTRQDHSEAWSNENRGFDITVAV